MPATIRYLDHSTAATTRLCGSSSLVVKIIDLWLEFHEYEPVPVKTHRAEEADARGDNGDNLSNMLANFEEWGYDDEKYEMKINLCCDKQVRVNVEGKEEPVGRPRFVEWAQNEIAFVPDFHKRILFSDEAHFRLNGYIHKQNCRIWSEANPQVYVETPLHPEKLTVWCALWADGIIGPYFFKNDEDHNVTVNGDRYRAMITNSFIPELNNHDVQELWFQQDGATCHTARAIIDLLKDTLGDRLISRFGPVN
ncbi:putative DD41D transposase [Trichonephila clavipes]|nr:putative DD41D transposase [Trichonephila clavipes]